jgi:very-short-patch-repair endonuclease
MCRGIPVTSVPRTLVDIAASMTVADLARACHEAGVRYGTTPAQVEAVLASRPSNRGAGKLREVLRGDARVTLSGLEARFLARLTAANLPLPQTNRPAGGRRVDCRWPVRRLTVELDGYRYHHSRHAWEQDRRREREAHARGDDFRRYTYGDVFEHPRQMLAELRGLLLL